MASRTWSTGVPCALVAAIGLLIAPASAQAHVRSGVVATSFRAVVRSVPPGVGARVDRSDLALRLTVASGHAVLVRGYGGEPFLRIDARGVAVQAASPTAAVTKLVKPGRGWQPLSDGRSVTWHDARVRGVPKGAKRRAWAVPLDVDGRRAAVSGVTTRVAAPPWWPWAVIGAAVLLAAALARRRGAVALGALAAVATIAAAIVFAADRYASAGTIVESVNEVVLALAGLAALLVVPRLPPVARYGIVAGLGTLGLFLGLTKFAALTHGVVLAIVGGDVARALVVVALAAGAGAVVVATGFFLSDDLMGQ